MKKMKKVKSKEMGLNRVKKKSGPQRDKAKENILKMYNEKPDLVKMNLKPTEPVRIQPDRRWFGNTRVITQSKLEKFRNVLEERKHNSYNVLLKKTALPTSLFLPESVLSQRNPQASSLLSFEPFEKTFGKNKLRKRAKISFLSFSEALDTAETNKSDYNQKEDSSALTDNVEAREAVSEEVLKRNVTTYMAGDLLTTLKVSQELYKVIDSSDVVIEVLDARDPFGSRCYKIEQHIKKNCPNKHIILLLNKCDLIPSWCSTRWLKILSSEYPTIVFHSSITNNFGKVSLLNLLRQYANFLKHRKHVSVGFIGYPNVGKSSVINTLKSKKVCKTAPIPGETKVWQYVSLTHRVHLIDCPGVVLIENNENETTKILKGVVRAERIQCPSEHIQELLNRIDASVLKQKYKLTADWNNSEEFLSCLAKRLNKLSKGGELDLETTARIVIYDWQRGRIPYFVPPPAPLEVQKALSENQTLLASETTENLNTVDINADSSTQQTNISDENAL